MRSKKAIINIISSVILQIITIICGFIVPKLIISKFGSDVNGLIVSITQFLAYITLLESGFGPLIKSILFKPIANKDKSTIEKILKSSERIFKTIAYIFLIYIVILCCILPFVLSKSFEHIYTVSLIAIIAVGTFAEYYFGMTYKIYLQAEQKNYIVNAIQIGTLILNTIIVIILIYLGCNIQIVKLASAILFVIRPIIQNVYVKRKYNINLKEVKEEYVIKQKWDALAQHIAFVIHTNTDVILITLCKNTFEVSVYSVYSMIVRSIRNIVQSITGGIDALFGDMIAKDENEALNKSFRIYETFYFMIASILFICTFILIIPFVSIYTNGITDINYIRPIFAILFVLAEFLYVIKIPYNDLVKVAGHFKQTKTGAIIEAVLNIVISLTLIWKYGIEGVIIGTVISTFIRTINLMYYSAKHILKRRLWIFIKKMIVIIINFAIVFAIYYFIPKIEITNYLEFVLQGIIIFVISAAIVFLSNLLFFKDDFKNSKDILRRILKKE